MHPHQYDKNTDYPSGAEVAFIIDPDQVDVDLPYEYAARFSDEREARDAAKDCANIVGHQIEVGVYAVFGHYGREYMDSFMVQPEGK